LNDNGILIIKINNTYILWLKGLKISITDSPPLSVIQQKKREMLPRRITWSIVEEINAPQNTDKECSSIFQHFVGDYSGLLKPESG
jgi:hypothetical protein